MKMISAVNKDNFWVKQIFILSFIALEVLLISIFVQSTITFSLSIIIILAVFIGLEYLVFVKNILEEIWIDTTTKNNIISAVVSSFVCLFLVIYAFISNIFGLILPSCIVLGVIAFFALFILIRKIVTLYESENKNDMNIFNKDNFWVKQIFILSVIALVVLLTSIFAQSNITFSLSIIIILTLFFGLEYLVFVKKILEEIWIDTTTKNNIISAVVSFLVCLSLVIYAFVSNIFGLILPSFIVLGVIAFFALFVVVKNIVRIQDIKFDITTAIFAVSSCLWVFVPLLPLYLTNINNVSLLFVLLLALLYIAITITLFFVSLFIFKSSFVSFCICVIGWFGLSLSESLITGIMSWIPHSSDVFSLMLLIIMSASGFVILKLTKKFQLNIDRISKFVLLIVAVLIIINIIPIVSSNIQTNELLSNTNVNDDMIFVVDNDLPHPNIYWIHAESMVDTTVLEKYWGEETVGFSEALEDREFYVNHDAYIDGIFSGYTTQALTSIFCPDFYDEYPLNSLDKAACLGTMENNHEFINAFDDAGYMTVSLITKGESYLKSPSEIIYSYNNDHIFIENKRMRESLFDKVFYYDLEQETGFLKYSAYPIASIFSLFDVESELIKQYDKRHISEFDKDYVSIDEKSNIVSGTDWMNTRGYNNLISALSYSLDEDPNPSMTIIYNDLVHVGYEIDENGNIAAYTMDVAAYYQQYLFCEKILLYFVDTILEHDTNAIIIIQGDHGPHDANFEGYIDFFSSDPNYTEYKLHTLSAVRIPEQYRTEDYPEQIRNPRNIVRYLINSYVGQNYEYIES